MSFSTSVKQELLSFDERKRHCLIAELAAIVNICGEVAEANTAYESKFPAGRYLCVSSENIMVAERFSALINQLFNYSCTVLQKKQSKFSILIDDDSIVSKVINVADIHKCGADFVDTEVSSPISHTVVGSVCCKRAYLRAAFLCCGSVTNPEKQYHLEFVNNDYDHAVSLKQLIFDFGIEAKIIERKNHYIVYLKEGEQIVDILNIISAHKALMSFENQRIFKEIRNKTNRIVNCETANINKTVSAAEKQREAIEYIAEVMGLDKLQPSLREVAQARLIYPFVSLKELGENMTPPIGKSGVNHRLKKICDIAEKLKGEI